MISDARRGDPKISPESTRNSRFSRSRPLRAATHPNPFASIDRYIRNCTRVDPPQTVSTQAETPHEYFAPGIAKMPMAVEGSMMVGCDRFVTRVVA